MDLEEHLDWIERNRNNEYKFANINFGLMYQDAENIFQDTILSLLEKSKEVYKEMSKVPGWFRACFRRKCLDFLRDNKRRKDILGVNVLEAQDPNKLNGYGKNEKQRIGGTTGG